MEQGYQCSTGYSLLPGNARRGVGPTLPLALLAALALGGSCQKETEPTEAASPARRSTPPARARAALRRPRGRRPPPPARPRSPSQRAAAPARPMPTSAFVTLVPRPSYGVLRKVLHLPKAEGVELWHLAPAGGKRYVTIATGRDRGQTTTWFRLVTFEKTPDGWAVRQLFLVDHPLFSARPGKGRVGAQVRVGDYDADGKPEAKVVYRFPTGPAGNGEIRKVAIVNLDGPSPRMAARFVLADRLPGRPSAQTGYFTLRDLNRDGHPDILLTTLLRRSDPRAKNPRDRVAAHKADTRLLWDQASDRYRGAYSTDELPPNR